MDRSASQPFPISQPPPHRRALRRAQRFAVSGLLAALALPAQSPVGPEIQVNDWVTGDQRIPAVAFDPDGGFVVVWQSPSSPGPDASGTSVQARRFAPDGSPLGVQFEVNGAFSTGSQGFPSVATDPDGNFVVVWSDAVAYMTEGIEARRYAADGTPLGGAFAVFSPGSGERGSADVATDDAGNFVVVWSEYILHQGSSVHGRRYFADGSPDGASFRVDSYQNNYQSWPSVDRAADGRFVVAWNGIGPGPDTDQFSIQARRFAADGTPLGPQFDVNDAPAGNQTSPDVAMSADGRFVVAWQSTLSPGTDSDGSSVHARRFTAAGAPAGGQFQVNSETTGAQLTAGVAMDDDGDFFVTWTSADSSGTDQSAQSIQARRYRADGAADGAQFQVNSFTPGAQLVSRIGATRGGDFAVVWESYGSAGTDHSGESIHAQRFTALFRDGFESGDTSAWSSTEP